MASVEAAEVREALDRAEHGERVVIERDGREVAAVVPIDDLKALERFEDLLDAKAYRKALAEWEEDGRRSVPLEALLEKYADEVPRV